MLVMVVGVLVAGLLAVGRSAMRFIGEGERGGGRGYTRAVEEVGLAEGNRHPNCRLGSPLGSCPMGKNKGLGSPWRGLVGT